MNERFSKIFEAEKPLIALIQLPPLPGSPSYRGEEIDRIVEKALQEAEVLKAAGIDGIEVENTGDAPYLRGGEIGHETVAAVSVVAWEVRRETGLPTGINILINGALEAAAAAIASRAEWIRCQAWTYGYISPSGYVESAASSLLRYLRSRESRIMIFAEVAGHGSWQIISDKDLGDLAIDAEFFGCDALVASGKEWNKSPTLEELERVKSASSLPVLVGGNVNPENIERFLRAADGVYVGSALRRGGVPGGPIDAERVWRLMEMVRGLR